MMTTEVNSNEYVLLFVLGVFSSIKLFHKHGELFAVTTSEMVTVTLHYYSSANKERTI